MILVLPVGRVAETLACTDGTLRKHVTYKILKIQIKFLLYRRISQQHCLFFCVMGDCSSEFCGSKSDMRFSPRATITHDTEEQSASEFRSATTDAPRIQATCSSISSLSFYKINIRSIKGSVFHKLSEVPDTH